MLPKHCFLRTIAGIFIGTVALLVLNHVSPYRLVLNKTPSMALGVYFLRPADRLPVSGDVVYFKYQEPEFQQKRQYFPDKTPFIKKVVGGAGAEISCANRVISVCSATGCKGMAKGKERDSLGREALMWCPSKYTLTVSEVIVAGDYPLDSLDSRFLGPVSVRQITHFAVPVITLSP